MTLVTSGGSLLLRAGQFARALACCCNTKSEPTGACCTNGVCSIRTKSDCAGVWQGANTKCSGGSCLGQCCVPEGTCGTAKYYNCRTGYFASTCTAAGGRVGSCTQAKVHPATGIHFCADGGPSQVTITVAGVTPSLAEYQSVADMCNASFVVDMPCSGQFGGSLDSETVDLETWYAYAEVKFSNVGGFSNPTGGSVSASLVCVRGVPNLGGTGKSGMTNSRTLPFDYEECLRPDSDFQKRIINCSDYAISAGGSVSYQDIGRAVLFTNATVALS